MNASDSARVYETAPGRYEVTYGPPALPGEYVAYTRHMSLRDACRAADGATRETAVAAARRSGYGTQGWSWAIDRGVWE